MTSKRSNKMFPFQIWKGVYADLGSEDVRMGVESIHADSGSAVRLYEDCCKNSTAKVVFEFRVYEAPYSPDSYKVL